MQEEFMEYQLVAIKIDQREDAATAVQKELTAFGCNIKVRLGLHDLPEGACDPAGLIVLQVVAIESELSGFLSGLNGIEGVSAKSLTI